MIPTVAQPTLGGDGLTLRPWQATDAPAFQAACADGWVPRWTGFPHDLTLTDAERLVEERIATASAGIGAAFAITDDEGRLLGSVSLFSIDWTRSLGVVAYWLAPESRGRGIATRAVRLLSEWAFDDLALGPSRA